MATEEPVRRARRSQAVPLSKGEGGLYDDLVGHLAGRTDEAIEVSRRDGRNIRRITVVEYSEERRTVHSMAGGQGYSLASNWFVQVMAQLFVANSVTRSQIAVFLYVAGGLQRNTGITEYTQQEITDGLNALAAQKPEARMISRSTVNRAVKALCEYQWIERVGKGRIRLNVTLWFSGSSAAQHEVLDRIAFDHDGAADAFPHAIGPADIPQQQELDLGLPAGETARVRNEGAE